MKILITGADGFIGSHLSEHLVIAGHEVNAFCQYNSFGHFGWLTDSPMRTEMNLTLGDIRDESQIYSISNNCDAIINLAALIGIPYSYQAPNSYVSTNIYGTLNLCNAAIKNNIKHFIQISTSEVYGTAKFVPIDENHPLQPQSPYSASKIGAEALALSYANAFDLPVTIARPFNTFGPRQSRRAVIPAIISQLLNKNLDFVSLGNINAIRDFNYITDTINRIVLVLNAENIHKEVYNLGGSGAFSIIQIFNKIKTILKIDKEISIEKNKLRPEKSEVEKLVCDSSKFDVIFGKYNPTNIDLALQKTIDWFIENKNNLLFNLQSEEI